MVDHPHVTYNVDGITTTIEPDNAGNFRKVHRVNYTAASGAKSHIDMPSDAFTAANVHDAIMDEAQHLDEVAGLQPGMPAPQPPPETL